jgi:hypothetical protein
MAKESKGTESPITIFGKEYSGIREAINALKPNVSEGVIRARKRYDWTPEEMFGLVERDKRKGKKEKIKKNKYKENRMLKQIVVEGVEYPSVVDAAKAYKIEPTIVYNRVARKKKEYIEKYGSLPKSELNKIIEDAVVTPKQVTPVTIDGVTYRSKYDALNKIGKVNLSTFDSRQREGKTLKYSLGLVSRDCDG